MNSVLESIEDATAIMDDIIIAGKMVENHDKVLKHVLRRSRVEPETKSRKVQAPLKKNQVRWTH